MNLSKLHKLSIANKTRIENSKECGCFSCMRTFAPSEIVEWVDDIEPTAVCPYCDVDAVLCDTDTELNEEVLLALNTEYFDA